MLCEKLVQNRHGNPRVWPDSGKKALVLFHYLPGHASHLRAKELRAGDQIRLIVEVGRNGRGLIKDVIPVLPAK